MRYGKTIDLQGFKTYSLYDQSQNATRIRYFLAQRHPVVMMARTETEAGPKGRFILLTGYDNSSEVFFVCDPVMGNAVEMTYKEFLESVPMIRPWADETKTMRRGTVIYPKN
jgi:hypothetical protein